MKWEKTGCHLNVKERKPERTMNMQTKVDLLTRMGVYFSIQANSCDFGSAAAQARLNVPHPVKL